MDNERKLREYCEEAYDLNMLCNVPLFIKKPSVRLGRLVWRLLPTELLKFKSRNYVKLARYKNTIAIFKKKITANRIIIECGVKRIPKETEFLGRTAEFHVAWLIPRF